MKKIILYTVLLMNSHIIYATDTVTDSTFMGIRVYRSRDDIPAEPVCNITKKATGFILSLDKIPSGKVTEVMLTAEETPSCKPSEDMTCSNISIPHLIIECSKSTSVSITLTDTSYSILDTTSTHNLDVYGLESSLGKEISAEAGEAYDLYIGAIFVLPDTLLSDTTYTWQSADALSKALTIDF